MKRNEIDKDYVEREAIKLVIARFTPSSTNFIGTNGGSLIQAQNSSGETLVHFLDDFTKGLHKKWQEFQLACSTVIGEMAEWKSGAPIKKRLPTYNTSFMMGILYDKETKGLKYCPQLPLHKCRTTVQKVRMIMDSDCSTQVKVDLIGVLK